MLTTPTTLNTRVGANSPHMLTTPTTTCTNSPHMLATPTTLNTRVLTALTC